MPIAACPGCGARINVPEGRSGRCVCPKCGKALMIKAPNSASPTAAFGEAETPATQPLSSQPFPVQPAASGFPAMSGMSSYGGVALPNAGQPRPAAASDKASLKAFVKRLGIGVGILSGVLLLLTGLGLINEPLAITAAGIGTLSTVLLLVWGRIWLLVIAFQESVVQGLLALFVPYYWMIYMATRKGRALLPLATVFFAMVPALLTLLMVAIFAGRFESLSLGGSGSTALHIPAAKLREMETRIRDSHASSAQANVLRTVSFPTFTQIRGPIDPAKAERALAGLAGYVAGSFRIDAQRQIVLFQYHGDKETAQLYAFFLPAKADIMMSLTPIFADETPTGAQP